MNWFARTCYLVGCWLLLFTSLQFLPLFSAVSQANYDLISSFLLSIFFNGFIGGVLCFGFRGAKRSKSLRVMIFLPFVTYIITAFAAALPFVFYYSETPIGVTFFEGMSMLTTMGSSAFREGIAESYPLVLWRALVSWCGGFTILIMVLTFFSRINLGALQLYPSEFAKGNKGAALGSVSSVAKAIYIPYCIFTLIAFIVFFIVGETAQNAFIRALSVVSTTGLPMAGEQDAVISSLGLQVAYCLLMTAVLINLDVLSGLWRSLQTGYKIRSVEFKILPRILLWGLALLIIIDFFTSSGTNYLDHYFMLVSSISTTGYTLDWWPKDNAMATASSVILFTFLIFGGSILTTTGGIGLLRLILLMVQSRAEISRLIHPSGIHPLKLGRVTIKQPDMDAVWILVAGFLCIFILGTVLLSIMGNTTLDSVAMSISALTTSGPMVSILSPYFPGFSGLSGMEYTLLAFLMLTGRLGVTMIFILCARAFWVR